MRVDAGPSILPRAAPALVADGCPHGRRQARILLGELGFAVVHEAADGAEAVGILGSVAPALVIMDWDLRVIGPSDLLGILRADQGREAPPVLVTMAEPSRSAVDRAIELCVAGIVAKPYSARTMRPRLLRLAGR